MSESLISLSVHYYYIYIYKINYDFIFLMQDILQELNLFLQGVTCKRKVPVDTLAQSALFLLQRVPAARHAVLEHFCYVFDDAAGTYIRQMDAGRKQEGWLMQ